MPKLRRVVNSSNPIVFLDIKIGPEKVGRIVIELRKDVIPLAAENFRALCTGEKGIGSYGKPLHYKGIRFHKVQRVFMAQGGDVVNNDGSCGESIYGPTFADENFALHHTEGAVSMANYGKPNTNNSQFFITSVNCSHLDGTNIAIGYVLRGLGIINEMEQYTTDDGEPTKDIIIYDCGQMSVDDDWKYCDNDETNDKLPPFPFDWADHNKPFTTDEMVTILNQIKDSGNYFFSNREYVEANRKYKKAQRYYNFFRNTLKISDDVTPLENFYVVNCVNIAAVELKFDDLKKAKTYCDEALKVDPYNAKALYRRGQAEIRMKNYDEAIEDLRRAHKLIPDSKAILEQFDCAKKLLLEYRDMQKATFKKLFK